MKRFKSILLLLIFLASIKGYSFEMHYCQGKITDISFIGHTECLCQHDDLKEEASTHENHCKKNCHSSKLKESFRNDLIKDSGCCKTEQVTLMSTSIKALSSNELPVIMAIVATLNPFFFNVETEFNPNIFKYYSPPILVEDITVLVRTFLI